MRRASLPRVCALVALGAAARAESGHDAWLRYERLASVPALPPAIVTRAAESPVVASAREELMRGVQGMTGRALRIEPRSEAAIVLATGGDLAADAFTIRSGGASIVITGGSGRGVLYGVFALLRRIAMGGKLAGWNVQESPHVAVRWVNHWDNLDGTIERGYGGRSIFWENGHARADLTLVSEYGRLLASLGINGCSINNVNANPRILASDFLPEIARIAAALRPWGVRTVLSVDFGSPQSIGGLKTFDPLDPAVAAWWRSKIDEIYRAVPDLGGVVLKAIPRAG